MASAFAIPYVPAITVAEENKIIQLTKVKGGKVSKSVGVTSKIPGFEFLSTAKYIYGLMASIIGAIMFGAFKFVGNWENKKYLNEKEKERQLGRSLNGSGGNRSVVASTSVDGKRPLVEKPEPLFGK